MIDITRKYKTRSGRDVVILTTDAPGAEPVVGYVIWEGEDTVTAESWTAAGKYRWRTGKGSISPLDLEEIK